MGVGELAQWFRVLVASVGDSGLNPSKYMMDPISL